MGGGRIRAFTWREGLDEARRMAAYLASLELPRPSQIAIFAKNNAWWILADLAIWMSGHVSVPLYPTLTAETIRQILEHSESRLIFIGKLDGLPAMEPGIPDTLPRIVMPLAPATRGEPWADIVARTAPVEGQPSRQPDELATIIYTSGSTGVPKGVMHSFRTMTAAYEALMQTLEVRVEDRMLSYLPLAHAFERWILETGTLVAGFEVFFAESLETFVDDLRRARPTLFVSVPRLWQKFQSGVFEKVPPDKLERLLRIPILSYFVKRKILRGLGLDAVRFAGSGSAPIAPELLAWYRRLGLELLEGYGMTENFSLSHASRPGEVRVGYVGRPYDVCEQRITEEGEVLVRSPGTMLGYFKAPELTAEVLTPDGWLRTGDRGEIDEMGRLRITGRVKELFKTSKGKYVAPAPIENRLLEHPDLEQACVSGHGRPQPFGLVVLAPAARSRAKAQDGRERLQAALREHLAAVNGALDPHEQLEFLAVSTDEWTIENGMLTPTLKLRRAAIEERYAPRVDEWYAAGQPIVWV
ncbi:MAG: AMP-binding protein [Myxococcota bacterium]|nr:AMP-binding protein [Myxococcota bacterium]